MIVLLALVTCDSSHVIEGDDPVVDPDRGDSGSSGDSGDSGDSAVDTAPPVDCDDLAPLPVIATSRRGFTGSEDFAFDGEGNVASVDENGNLVRQTVDGDKQVWLPRFGEASGMRFLPGGDLVIASPAEGALYRVTPEGGSWVLVSGLVYPNGVDVDGEGFVYVAEQGAGRVSRVDAESGEWTVAAEGLYNPNGVSFSGDFSTMYVGSFGDGTITAVDRDGQDWAPPRLWAATSDAPVFERGGGCDDLAPGEACYLDYGGVGLCDAALACVEDPDLAACEGRETGDACVTALLGEPVAATCTADLDGVVFCPRADAERVEECKGIAEYGVCSHGREEGYCFSSWEAVAICVTVDEYSEGFYGNCDTLSEGDACVSDFAPGPFRGVCTDYSSWGYPELVCAPPGGIGERGGLDGINVDACDNVYVTEYIKGMVWRFAAEGAAPEEVAELDSYWIPNLHWGLGIGGWEREEAYVMDRERGRLFALPLGVEEKARAFDPGAR